MLKKGLLFIACALFVISSPVFGEEAASETTLDTTAVAKSVEIEPSTATESRVVDTASEWNAPEWIRDAITTECTAGATTNWGPLVPGDCDDCAGGCSIRCSNHSQCMQRCPNNIGVCTQSGKCLCAC